MGQTGDQAHQYRFSRLLGEVKTGAGHVVGLLLVAGFVHGDEGEVPVEAAVLLVLRGVHAGVVRGHHHQSAPHACDAGIDKAVRCHVHAHVLHAHHGALACERHAQRCLHGRLFIGRPAAVHFSFGGFGSPLYIFGDFGGGSARIGIDAGKSGIQRPLCEGFVSQ